MTCKYKVKIKDIQYNYKVQMADIQSKYKFKVFCTGYDDSEIKEKIDAMYQAWPKVSGEGETITLNDTANTTMAIDLKGNTSQETTTGKNLFDINSVTSVTNGSISNEIITTNETSNSNYSVFPYFSNISLPANTYYLSMDIRIKSGTGYFNKINDATTDWTAVSKPSLSTTFQRYVYSHTYTSVTTLNHILIQFISSTNAVYEITNIMLSTSSDTNFEKYTGGNPAPNPDYPQAIANVTGTNTIKINGKNLFDKDNVIVGKVYNSNGELVNSKQWNTNNDFEKVNENKVSISCKTTGSVNSLLIEFDENKNFIQRQQVNYGSSSLTLNTNTKYIRYCYQNTLGMYDIQIEESSTATTYEAYKEQNYTINLEDIELCKIDTYKDRIYPLNGKWYLEKQVGKVVLNGSENWSRGNPTHRYFTTISGQTDLNVIPMSNYYVGYANSISSDVNGILLQHADTSTIRINIYNLNYVNNLADFKSWLSTHNVEVYYVLATPTTEEITDSTLISQLEEIKEAESYLGQTNISQTNDDKPFILTATALKDLSSL